MVTEGGSKGTLSRQALPAKFGERPDAADATHRQDRLPAIKDGAFGNPDMADDFSVYFGDADLLQSESAIFPDLVSETLSGSFPKRPTQHLPNRRQLFLGRVSDIRRHPATPPLALPPGSKFGAQTKELVAAMVRYY